MIRHPHWLLVLLVLAQVTGCGRQDRYTVADPSRGQLDVLASGTGELIPTMVVGKRVWAVGGWSPSDLLLGTFDGSTLRVADGTYTTLAWPGESPLVGFICDENGSAHGLDAQGLVCELDDGRWVATTALPYDHYEGYYWDLQEDREGRLVAFARQEGVWRQEDGVWTQTVAVPGLRIRAGWAGEAGGSWVLATDGQTWTLAHETATGWELTQPFGAEPIGDCILAGDGEGRLAVSFTYSNTIWILDEGAWTTTEPTDSINVRLFWLNGSLYAVGYRGEIYGWQEPNWTSLHSDLFVDAMHLFCTRQLNGIQIIAHSEGSVVGFDGQEADPILPGQGSVVGVCEVESGLYLLTDRGELYRRIGEAWSWVATLPDQCSQLPGTLMVRGSDGQLLVLGRDSLWRFDGQDFVLLEDHVVVSSASDQYDGEVLVAVGQELGSLTVSGLEMREQLAPEPGALFNALRLAADHYLLLYPMQVGSLQDGVWRTELVCDNWAPVGLVRNDRNEVLIHGIYGCRLYAAGVATDLTPIDRVGTELRVVNIDSALHCGGGRWLAWSRESTMLLLHDQTGWHELVLTGSPDLLEWERYSGTLTTAVLDNESLLFDTDTLIRITLEGGGP